MLRWKVLLLWIVDVGRGIVNWTVSGQCPLSGFSCGGEHRHIPQELGACPSLTVLM